MSAGLPLLDGFAGQAGIALQQLNGIRQKRSPLVKLRQFLPDRLGGDR